MSPRQEYREAEGIQCLVCGHWFKALSTHVIRAHGFSTAQEYREEFGLLHRGLVSLNLAQRMAEIARETGFVEKGKATRLKKDRTPAVSPLSAEGRELANQNLVPGLGQPIAAHTRRTRTHCRHGHPYDAENTRLVDGARVCRECGHQQKHRQRQKQRGQPPPTHGLYGYRDYACRCETCRSAATEAKKRYLAKKRGEAAK